jgi:hypothetical protein
MAPTNTVPPPRKDPAADSTANEGGERGGGEGEGGRGGGEEEDEAARGDDEDEEDPPIDLGVEVEDASGRTARVTLSDYGAIRRPLETYVMRRRDQESSRFQTQWELILQTYSIPLADFTAANGSLDLSRLSAVRFVFDRVHAGEVVIDGVGFSALPPGFLEARVDGR